MSHAPEPVYNERQLAALEYHHRDGRSGKISVTPTKPLKDQGDLSLAYTPGVAVPVLEIARQAELAYEYTDKGNLVAVITNGTAVLGLGQQGALAAKPVMEGKGILFKTFADIDVFDLELNTQDPEELVRIVTALAPTFGGINLEDIKAPECFLIEQALKESLDIPVFHDDQHGTAVIAMAGVLNGLRLVGKRIEDIRVVCVGAGAAASAAMNMLVSMGTKRENIVMVDAQGVIYQGRPGLSAFKEKFAIETTCRTLEEAFVGRDVFYGLSVGNIVTPQMLQTMAPSPLIFSLANPNPEISYRLAKETRPDAIVGTGRSDLPNQINNVLGFPFIFRGALDVHARCINEHMKRAASLALAQLAREKVPEHVLRAYGLSELSFGPDYILPKPLDRRVLIWVASAVAQAAMESGVARKSLDLEQYRQELRARQRRMSLPD